MILKRLGYIFCSSYWLKNAQKYSIIISAKYTQFKNSFKKEISILVSKQKCGHVQAD